MNSKRKWVIVNRVLLVLILFATTLFGNTAEKLWSLKMVGKNIDASVAIGDVDRDGHLDIVVGSTMGAVIALDSYGRKIWETDLKDQISIAPTLMNVAGDSGLEVLILTLSGKIICLDGLTGNTLWKESSLGKIKWASMTVVVADINSDGKNEIVVGDEAGKLVCLDGNGKKLWEYIESEGIGSAPAVGDLDGDGMLEIIIASEDTPLICLNNEGKLKWRVKPDGNILSFGRKREVTAPIIHDINGDGIAEIVTGMGFELVAVNNKGVMMWSFPIKNRIDSGISIADADGDGEVEIYATNLAGNIVCVTADGKLKWSESLGGRSRRSPTIADVDGDGIVEILAAGYGGKLKIFNPTGKLEQSLLIKGGTNATPTIANLFGDGGLCTIVPEISGNLVVYRWQPVLEYPNILWPEYRGFASRTACGILQSESEENNIIDENAYRVGKQELVNNLSELKELQNKLTELIPQLIDSKILLERVYFLTPSIEKSENQIKNINDLVPIKKRELRDKLVELKTELYKLSKIAKLGVEEDKIIVAYAANPWASFGGMGEIIEGRTLEAKITVEAFQGEFESAAVNLFNFSGNARTLRVVFSEFFDPNGKSSIPSDDVFAFCETIDVPTQDANLSADALPELNTGNLLVIPAWEGRQLWIKINSANLTPGIWKAKIHLKSLDVQYVETVVELNIKIWDVPFPEEQPLSLCNWSGTSKPEGTFNDQISHGVNVFTQSIPAKIEFNESGEITDIDWSDHDTFMESHAAKGTLLFHSLVSISGSSSAFSPAWLKAYRSFIPQWIKHLKELSYGYDNFAFYPVDEPGLENGKKVNQFMKWAKLVREIDPRIRIYTNPAEQITIEQLKEMNPYVDIWTPHQIQLFPEMELDYIQSTNGLLWNYECLENAKNLSPLGYYRGQAWMSWSYGHTGIGFYTYYQGRNFWFQPESGFEYAMIYEGKGVVTSKRWEAVRDGVEDYSLLNALKIAVDHAEKTNVKNDLVEKARTILNEKASVIAGFIKINNNNKVDGAVARKIADERWKKITEIRSDIAELLVQFQR